MNRAESIDAVINLLYDMQNRKRFYRGYGGNELEAMFHGMRSVMHALNLLGNYYEYHLINILARGWSGNALGVIHEMLEQKMELDKIFDELIQIETETWKQVRDDFVTKT